MPDPFAKAASRIIGKIGASCVHVSYETGDRTKAMAVLDRDVEIIDELGQVVERDDAISLLVSDVEVPKNRDTVEFDSGETYMLGRKVKSDGYVTQMLAHRKSGA